MRKAAEMLGITGLLDRLPRQLSGGQRQRVAIGRAIVRNARLFLFDEPLSNLDAQLRDEMRSEIKRLHQELGRTMIYVTHDQIEAMTLADRIVLLKDGLIEQAGSPLDLYERPATLFVAGFLGSPQDELHPGKAGGQRRGMAVQAGRRHDPAAGRQSPGPGRRRRAARSRWASARSISAAMPPSFPVRVPHASRSRSSWCSRPARAPSSPSRSAAWR